MKPNTNRYKQALKPKPAKLVMIPGSQFSWQTSKKLGFADMSDLNVKGIPREFFILSERTGKRVKFTCVERIKDEEGDLAILVYKSEDKQYTVKLFND